MCQIGIGYTYKKSQDVPTATHPAYHDHPHDELLIVHSGDVVVMTPNTYLSHKGPCVIFYKKNMPHTQINLQGTLYERYCIGFERNDIIEFLPDLSFFTSICRQDALLLPLTDKEDTCLFSAAKLLYSCSQNGGNENKKKLLLCYILSEISDISQKHTAPQPVHFYLTEVTQYIAQHIDEKITIDNISEHFKISRAKLIRDFKEFFSMSVLDFITLERLVRAKEMLRRGQAVSKTAELCGFVDSAYFIKVFKKHCGITPAAYKKSSSENPNYNGIVNV